MRQTRNYAPLLALLPLVALGCAQPMSETAITGSAPAGSSVASGMVAEAKAVEPMGDAPPAPPQNSPRKIIYTAEYTLVTEDLDSTAAKLEAKVKSVGGYIGNANRSGVRGVTREGSWTVRVPVAQFDGFVAGLTSLGELESSSRKADDVSEEFYDVQARLKNKRLEEARLLDLLQKATGKLTEVLTVEKELSRVREEIERIEGRLRFLSNQTDLATVTVTLREVKNFVPEGPPTLATQVRRSFGGSVDALQNFATGVLLVVVALVPWLAPLALFVAVVVRLARLRKPRV